MPRKESCVNGSASNCGKLASKLWYVEILRTCFGLLPLSGALPDAIVTTQPGIFCASSHLLRQMRFHPVAPKGNTTNWGFYIELKGENLAKYGTFDYRKLGSAMPFLSGMNYVTVSKK